MAKKERKEKTIEANNSEILLYQNPDGNIKIDVRLQEETVWLTQAQLCQLFNKSKATVSEHIKNIFDEGELNEKVVVRKFRTTTQHGAIAIVAIYFYFLCFSHTTLGIETPFQFS